MIKSRSVKRELRLTEPEAEVLFIIWKSNRPIQNSEIADEHYKYFGPRGRKDESTVRGILSRIKNRRVSKRKYITSNARPQVHQIDKDECVHSQASAVMLLELKTGYMKYGRPEVEILREPFETYIAEKYKGLFKDQSDVSDRLRKAEKSGYAKFVRHGKSPGVEASTRLDDDLEYLLLIVEDYIQELGHVTSSGKSNNDLRNLLSLFGRTPRLPSGRSKGRKSDAS